jgi:hypothetical protein
VRKAGVELEAHEPLFLDRCNDPAVDQLGRQSFAVVGIDVEDIHHVSSPRDLIISTAFSVPVFRRWRGPARIDS